MRHLALILLCLLAAPLADVVSAQSTPGARVAIGNGRLFSNDLFGDGHDRWRTGSYVFSHLRSAVPYDSAPKGFGEVMEYRFRTEIIAPTRRTRDRPYAGIISLGAHTHHTFGPAEISLGADVLAIGPQTRLSDFQRAYHEVFSLPRPPTRNQLSDQFALQATGEARYTYRLNPRTSLRPFVEGQTGAENLLRAGADLIMGPVGQNDLLLRDVTTGQLYRGTQDDRTGVSLVVGGDVTAVDGSLFLPESEGYAPTETRTRARAGLNWQPVPGMTFFYGATYLSPEFKGQDEGQVVGSLKLNFNF
ncbi:lipid A-modifier LpxR family protein [Loktanella sp. DJP18]|uniref:lipid A-modifier LpxR family protein n=1 Tax=Loktanella sp. DJP18 TaxID=3409788 RepID=UPI003BB4F5E4